MKYNRKKIRLFLYYASVIGGTQIHPLFAAQQKDDGRLITNQSQYQSEYHSDALSPNPSAVVKDIPKSLDVLFEEIDKEVEENIKKTEKKSKEKNAWINAMIKKVEEEGDRQYIIEQEAIKSKQKAIDDEYQKEKEKLVPQYGAVNQQIEEKSYQDYADFLARKKAAKEKEKASLQAIKKKRKKEVLREEKEKKELQRRIDALKKKKQPSNASLLNPVQTQNDTQASIETKITNNAKGNIAPLKAVYFAISPPQKLAFIGFIILGCFYFFFCIKLKMRKKKQPPYAPPLNKNWMPPNLNLNIPYLKPLDLNLPDMHPANPPLIINQNDTPCPHFPNETPIPSSPTDNFIKQKYGDKLYHFFDRIYLRISNLCPQFVPYFKREYDPFNNFQ